MTIDGISDDTGTLRGDLLRVIAHDVASGTPTSSFELMAAARRNDELMRVVSEQIRQPGRDIGRLPLQRAIARGELGPETRTLHIGEVAMPRTPHPVLWREPVDDAFVAYVVDVPLGLLRPTRGQLGPARDQPRPGPVGTHTNAGADRHRRSVGAGNWLAGCRAAGQRLSFAQSSAACSRVAMPSSGSS